MWTDEDWDRWVQQGIDGETVIKKTPKQIEAEKDIQDWHNILMETNIAEFAEALEYAMPIDISGVE